MGVYAETISNLQALKDAGLTKEFQVLNEYAATLEGNIQKAIEAAKQYEAELNKWHSSYDALVALGNQITVNTWKTEIAERKHNRAVEETGVTFEEVNKYITERVNSTKANIDSIAKEQEILGRTMKDTY
jgi:hypothetical protein